MKIAFHIYHFTYRGSEVASFDYAYYNRTILGNESIILCPRIRSQLDDLLAVQKFQKEFKIIEYNEVSDVNDILQRENVDAIYTLKYGKDDGFEQNIKVPTFVHCVFTTNFPHGSVYAGVSDSVSSTNPSQKFPVVNHVVYLPDVKTDYRKEIGIPDNAIVLGRHGGTDTFNIPFVVNAMKKILVERDDVWFLFCVKPDILNDPFFNNHPRVKFFPSFSDNRIKRKFINTCDMMIHACTYGESFGLSILEFAYCGKPILTWNGGSWHKQHIDNLKELGGYYNNEKDLYNFMSTIDKNMLDQETKNGTFRIDNFSPETIMKQFKNVFIDSITK